MKVLTDHGTRSSSTMLTLFDGSIDDLTPMLTEERFADRWEPRIRDRFGLTMMGKTSFEITNVVSEIESKVVEV